MVVVMGSGMPGIVQHEHGGDHQVASPPLKIQYMMLELDIGFKI